MIEIQQLTKRYGDTVAIDGLTFTVRPGRVTGFLGPNGAGKSTTLRMMLGLERPDRGRVRYDGAAYHELREPLRHVGALLDARAVQKSRTAYHHLCWLARTNRIGRARVRAVLAAVGLEPAATRRAGGLSLGMAQRLGIAAALLGDPPVLLLDEPVNGLDPQGVRWIRTLMRGLAAEGRTVLVSSHLMAEMAVTADHLVVIGRGRLLADSGTDEFVARHCRPRVSVRTVEPDRLLGALARAGLSARQEERGAVLVEGVEAERVGRIAAGAGLVLEELTTRTDSLEDAFLGLTGGATQYRAGVVPEGGADVR
ncbi:ABC transporter ATP-binding protein [Streptomyces sp. CBMA156]|uniref:ABC transporter ATP-binding protein n=1 Tax=Streptomyces sp. CBMA156 TaxID=1930280 RepID=UPI001661A9B4|nr:ATP-binding cassette domain-containing protein [Streptomyces sp. CBMA156]MBD0670746.1 multidrug ABC transporter ATP-binding protein [Streptomyces sp. CBMA156]